MNDVTRSPREAIDHYAGLYGRALPSAVVGQLATVMDAVCADVMMCARMRPAENSPTKGPLFYRVGGGSLLLLVPEIHFGRERESLSEYIRNSVGTHPAVLGGALRGESENLRFALSTLFGHGFWLPESRVQQVGVARRIVVYRGGFEYDLSGGLNGFRGITVTLVDCRLPVTGTSETAIVSALYNDALRAKADHRAIAEALEAIPSVFR